MKSRLLKVLLFVFIFAVSVKGNNISINSFPLMEGLPSNTIQRVFQDREGFLWLGTLDGLCRYDAYRLLVFRSDVNNPDLLTNNEITCIAEDNNNNLLIGTKRGLNVLNKKTYSISPFCDSVMRNQDIKAMKVTRDGAIWIGTTSMVYCFNPDFSLRRQYGDVLPATSVNSFYEDEDSNLWLMLWNEGLYKYNKEQDDFVRMPRVGKEDNPFCLFVDSRNRFWLCTWNDGVFIFDTKDKAKPYKHINIINREKQMPENIFFSIAEDDTYGYVWLMSTSGIYAFEHIGDDSLKEVNISGFFKDNNNIYSEIIKDRTGNLLIATFSEGLLSVNFEKPRIENYTFPYIKDRTGLTPNITSLYKDEDGDIWLYLDRWGLALYKPEEDRVVFCQDIPALRDVGGFDVINNISGFRSMPGTIWVASDNDKMIYSIKKENGKIVSSEVVYQKDISASYGNPFFFYEDKKGNVWISTSSGLYLKLPDNEYIEPVDYNFGIISGITEDAEGRIWVSTKNAGIYIIPSFSVLPVGEPKHLTKASGELLSDNIESIHTDKNGYVWIGTNEGYVFYYDAMTQDFTDVTMSLNLFGEKVLTLLDDQLGHIWAMTDKRIIEYDPSTKALRDYTTADGIFVSSFRTAAFYNDDKAGRLYFGGNKGISVFKQSESFTRQPKESIALITDVKVNNEQAFSMRDKDRFDITTQTLILEPDDKNIEIGFSSLNYVYPSKIRFAYKMEGVDDKWVYTNNRQYAFYNKLSKGRTTLLVKATDENNQWNPVASRLSIYKRPAIYETWWAYIIYFVFFIVVAYFTYKIITNRIKLRNEIKIIQIEKEKSEELTQTKLRYFTNISHDFLTPLTILSCLVDDAEAAYKNNSPLFGSMRSNINKLIRLIQQVLDFRKIENDKMNLNLSRGNIVKFVRDICYTNFPPLIKKKKISFNFVSASEDIQAYFDADKIDKITYNLLSNAFKYTQDGGSVVVDIEKEGRWFVMKVTDSGVGIDSENLPHIFTRFYNNDKSIARETNGIGLSLAKELVTIHKGHISVRSEPGEGSVFIVRIPIDKASYGEYDVDRLDALIIEGATFSSEEIAVPDYDENKLQQDSSTILIVEDDEELRSLVKKILSYRYRVLSASDGVEALSVINEENVDIIISDVMMPNMDGLEFCRTIKKDIETSHIPVILLTAKNSVDERAECYNAGADAYISKPFDLKVLDARIKNFAANKKTKQKAFQEDEYINLSKLEYQSIDEKFLSQAVKLIEDNLQDVDFDVNVFAGELNMSKSSLYRKLKTITGLSPVEFIRNIRLKIACQRLKDRSISISEVAYAVGFSDPKYFAKCFKNEFNITPSEFQKKS